MMKKAKVKCQYQGVSTRYLIENFDDLYNYIEILNQSADNALIKTIKGSENLSEMENGIIMHAALKNKNENPIYHLDGVVKDKIEKFITYLTLNKKILINDAGGFCFLDDKLEVLKVWTEQSNIKEDNYCIVEGAKVINLENDPELEQHSIDYMESDFGKYSYITNLRLFDKEDLIKVFKEFLASGGEILYIYTTGQDVGQMYQYTGAAIEAGIKEMVLEFNSGINSKHEEYLTHFKNKINIQ